MHCYENSVAFVCKTYSKPTLGETATGVMRENVKREVVTHHALRITDSVFRVNVATGYFRSYRRAAARDACFEK